MSDTTHHFWLALHRFEDQLESQVTWAERQISRTVYGYKSRVERLRAALADSRAIAWKAIALKLEGIDLSTVWGLLYSALHDIALYYGGTVVLGTAIGAGAGAFAGGIGAVPGAAIGMAAGAQLGGAVLGYLGLAMAAKGLSETFPQALACYGDGFRAAWGPATQEASQGRHALNPAASEKLAAHRFADGHVLMAIGLLIAFVFYLTKGGSDEALMLKAVRGSKRLGPKMADWLEKNKELLKNHPALQRKPRRPPEQDELPSSPARQSGNTARAAGKEGSDAKVAAQTREPRKPTVFSGHGGYNPKNRTLIVPEGTEITFYSAHGASISDDLGNAIETGQDVSNVFQRSYGPGGVIPNYTLVPPDEDLNILGDPVTVTKPTNLSELLKPGMGKVHWAACTHDPGMAATRDLVFTPKGIFDESVEQYTTLYGDE